jgi:hypothetical protein
VEQLKNANIREATLPFVVIGFRTDINLKKLHNEYILGSMKRGTVYITHLTGGEDVIIVAGMGFNLKELISFLKRTNDGK